MTTRTAQPRRSDRERGDHTRSSWIAAAAVAAVAVVVAVAAVWWTSADDAVPAVTFDGESATYDGPTDLEAGDTTFVFDSSDFEPGVTFLFAATTDDSITADDVEQPRTDPRQPWFDNDVIARPVTVTGDSPDARIVERSIPLEPDTHYVLMAFTGPSGGDWVHFVTMLDVD